MRKVLTLIAGTVLATQVSTNGDCSVAGSTCPANNCCGDATPVNGGLSVKRCYTSTATSWTDPASNMNYVFSCSSSAPGANSAMNIGVGLATLITLALLN